MITLSKLLGRQSGPRLAVEFRAEEIALFSLQDDEWRELNAVRIDAPDLNDRASDMRRIASKLAGAKEPEVDVWLPGEQVINLDVDAAAAGARPKQAALAAITKDGALTADELVVDTTVAATGHAASAVEKVVVREARDYIERWGFSPQRVTTRHGHSAFHAGPTFHRVEKSPPPAALAGVAAALLTVFALGFLAFGGGGEDEVVSDPPVLVELDKVAEVEPAEPPETPTASETTEAATVEATPPQEDAPALEEAPQPEVLTSLVALTPLAASTTDPAPIVLGDPMEAGPTIVFGDLSSVLAAPSGSQPVEVISPKELNPRLLTPSVMVDVVADNAPPLEPSPLDDPINPAALGDAPTATPEIGDAVAIILDDLTNESAAPDSDDEVTLDASSGTDAEGADVARPSEGAENAPTVEEVAVGEVDAVEERAEELADTPELSVAEPVEEDEFAPGPGAVSAAPAPLTRPDSLDMTPSENIVASAPAPKPRPSSIRPRPAAVAGASTASSATVMRVQRGPPTGPGVANAATLSNALELSDINLLGVFGRQGSRRALLRMPNGDVMRVTRGAVVDGWIVSRIDGASLRITRGGEAQTLNVVQ